MVLVFAQPGHRLGVERRTVELKIVGLAAKHNSDQVVVRVEVVKVQAELATGGAQTPDVVFQSLLPRLA